MPSISLADTSSSPRDGSKPPAWRLQERINADAPGHPDGTRSIENTEFLLSPRVDWIYNTVPRRFPGLSKRVVASVGDDDVVDHLNSEEPSSLGEPSRHGSVLRARRRIAARMVVDQNEGTRRASDRFSKNLPWMHKARRECPSRHFFFCDKSMASVQQEDEK